MQTVTKIAGAAATASAANYFLDLENAELGDYYLGEDDAPERPSARVIGKKLGAALGLGAEADRDQFLHLLDSRHPISGKRLIPWSPRRISGYDLTCSAPKSVSVLWALGDERLRREVQAAQDAAVDAMMAHIEGTFDLVQRKNKAPERAESLLSVAFAHHTSRQTADAAQRGAPPDPQLHTHTILMMGRRSDGRVVALRNQQVLWKRRAESMAVYHSALAAKLAELGFAIERRTGNGEHFFEVAGVSQELCDEWSSRRKEVSAYLEKWAAEYREVAGRDPDMVQRREPGARNRAKKGNHQPRDLRTFWEVVGAHYGVTAGSLDQLRRPGGALPEPAFAHALLERELFGEEGVLTGKQATFTTTQARTAALESAAGLLPPDEILQWLEDRVTSGETKAVGEDVWTTREILGLEKAVLTWDDQRAQLPSPPRPTQDQLWDGLKQQPVTLSGEQRDALGAMLSGRSTYVTGEAGVGKGVVVHAAADVWKAQGRRVYALALAGAAAQRLGADLGDGVETMTLHALVARVSSGRLQLGLSDVLVVDEAGVVDTRLWAKFVEAAGLAPTVVAVGDHAQLSPIGVGGLWPLLSKDGPQLTEVRRTKLSWEKRAWGMLRRGEEEALATYAKRGHLKVLATRMEAIQEAVADWSRDGHTGLIITDASNAERYTANQMAQEQRRQHGELGAESVRVTSLHGPVDLRLGDRVIFHGIHRFPWVPHSGVSVRRVENGTTGEITAVDVAHGMVTVRTNESKPRDLQLPDTVALDLHYAAHVYKAQGSTVDHAYIVAGGWQTAREPLYVACSRSRDGSYLYLDRETLERDTDADALVAAAKRGSRMRAKAAATKERLAQAAAQPRVKQRAPTVSLLTQLNRQEDHLAAERSKPWRLPSRWEAMVNRHRRRQPSPAAVAHAHDIPAWVAEAAQHVTGRTFGATG